jgi:hypothetical protein
MNRSALHPLLTVLMLVSMCAARAAAQTIGAKVNIDLNATEQLRLILIVNDEVGLPAQLLQEARRVTAKIFQHASVDIVWLAARGAAPEEPPAPETVSEWEFWNARYVVRIARSDAGRSPSSALGFTVPGTRTTTVVYPYVEQVARSGREDVTLVLGHVMAHELGHLLLRSSAHSTGGLMRATLDMGRAARGVLLFTDTEEKTIRASLSLARSL